MREANNRICLLWRSFWIRKWKIGNLRSMVKIIQFVGWNLASEQSLDYFFFGEMKLTAKRTLFLIKSLNSEHQFFLELFCNGSGKPEWKLCTVVFSLWNEKIFYKNAENSVQCIDVMHRVCSHYQMNF